MQAGYCAEPDKIDDPVPVYSRQRPAHRGYNGFCTVHDRGRTSCEGEVQPTGTARAASSSARQARLGLARPGLGIDLDRAQEAIRGLPPDQRQAILLRFFAGMRNKEVGKVMNRSEGAVKLLVFRAVSNLRKSLSEGRA